MQHWLPYDERRLYLLLGVDRGDDLAPAARRHAQPGRARASSGAGSRARWRTSSSRRGASSCATRDRLALLEERALRTLTQGHLAQHLFFHSLHQEAIPSHATAIFGVASRAEWSTLRRSELSPLQICRLNGLPRGHAQEQAVGDAARVRRPRASRARRPRPRRRSGCSRASCASSRAGCSRRATTARRRSSRRARRPPPRRTTPTTRRSSGDGRRVVFESYQAKLAIAKRLGEIAVHGARGRRGAPPVLASGQSPDPALELQPGAVGRRPLGRLRVGARQPQLRQALRAHGDPRARPAQRPHDPGQPSARPGDLALGLQPDDLRRRAADRLRGLRSPRRAGRGHARRVRDLRSGREQAVPAPAGMAAELYEPRLSRRRPPARLQRTRAPRGRRSRGLRPRPARAARSRRVSGPRGGGVGADALGSRHGRRVHRRRPGGESHVVVRDLKRGRARDDRLAGRLGRSRSSRRCRPTAGASPSWRGPAARADAGVRARPAGAHDAARLARRWPRRPARRWAARATRRSRATAAASPSPRRPGTCRPRSATARAGSSCATSRRDTTRPASSGDGGNRYLGPTKGSSARATPLSPSSARDSRTEAPRVAPWLRGLRSGTLLT